MWQPLSPLWWRLVGSLVEIGWYSNTTMDKGVVLLEQAWVFWLGDNLEDLEMGAR